MLMSNAIVIGFEVKRNYKILSIFLSNPSPAQKFNGVIYQFDKIWPKKYKNRKKTG